MSTKLFQPIKVGTVHLDHRVVMAPLTRFRCDESHVPLPSMVEYYAQRASTPGTLLIAEAVCISEKHCFLANAPGLWTDAQIAGWKKVVDAVHAKGCPMYCQIIAPGRAGTLPGHRLFSSSAVPMEEGMPVPEEMSEEEIQECLEDFGKTARNAIEAGFDGVELHGANGYLIDQFTQDTCNKRTDRWGGSYENRSRFGIEAVKTVVEAIGSERTAIRPSPWSTFQAMKMAVPEAQAQFSDLITRLKPLNLSYLHLIESRVVNNVDCEKQEGLEFAFQIWANQSPIIVAGGFTDEKARRAVDEEYKEYDTLVAFGRHFVSTPDLVYRLKKGLALNQYDRSTFYTPKQTKGYTDYPFSSEFLGELAVQG